MELPSTPARQVLDAIRARLDGFDADLVGPGDRLECARVARGLASRLTALSALLLARADAAQELMQQAGTPTTSWLAIQGGLSKREAAGMLHQARDLAGRPDVAQAAAEGRVSVNQARAIHTVLGGLDGLDEAQQAQAEELLLAMATSMDTDRLAKAAPQVLALVAPQQADETLERRLQRQAEAAQRNRCLVFRRDGNGSILFTGSLPLVDGQAWIAQLDAYTESRRRTALEERDPLADTLTPQQRRADALVAMVSNHGKGHRAPKAGGDRPRVVVTLDYDKLLAEATAAGLVGDGEPLSAGDLRRLCCDADLLPAVLGGPSTILDVGRDCRLVPPDMRAALILRDSGCVFPGCTTRPSECEAHHIVPWWQGGPTALRNLVLLCHHHHGLLEPARYSTRDQWEIRIATDGLPETIPPRDATQTENPSATPDTSQTTTRLPETTHPTNSPADPDETRMLGVRRTVEDMKTTRAVLLLVGGILLIAVGLVWTLQGIGVLAGSAMSGSTLWAVIGPIVAIIGIYLVSRWWRSR